VRHFEFHMTTVREKNDENIHASKVEEAVNRIEKNLDWMVNVIHMVCPHEVGQVGLITVLEWMEE